MVANCKILLNMFTAAYQTRKIAITHSGKQLGSDFNNGKCIAEQKTAEDEKEMVGCK